MDSQLAKLAKLEKNGKPPILIQDCEVFFKEDEETRDRTVAMKNCTVHFGESSKNKRKKKRDKNTQKPTNQVQIVEVMEGDEACQREAPQAIEAPPDKPGTSNPLTTVVNATAIGTCVSPGIGSAVGAGTGLVLAAVEAICKSEVGNPKT